MGNTIRIDLTHKRLENVCAWVIISMHARDEKSGPAFHADIAQALPDDCTDTLSPAVRSVLGSEIQAGMLMGLKQAAHRHWDIRLCSFGASENGVSALLSIPSDGFAVAATLAVAHGSGAEDLHSKPHGGYLWSFAGIDVTAA